MQTLKAFHWLPVALRIKSILNVVLKALEVLVPTYVSNTTFFLDFVFQTL